MTGDLIETLKIMNVISNHSKHFFNISSWTGNLLSRKSLKTNQMDFFTNRVIYFWNKLPNQIKNSNSAENVMIKLEDFRKIVEMPKKT